MVTYLEVFQDVIQKIEDLRILYMIVGAFGSIAYGKPRLTNDLDLVIIFQPQDIKKFCRRFPLDEFYCPPEEAFLKEIKRGGQLNLIHHQSGLKIDLIIKRQDSYCLEAFKRRIKRPIIKGFEAYLASPEDIIIGKLKYYKIGGSEKHLRDIKAILESQKNINKRYIEKWAEKLNLIKEWEKALKF